jgi:hypothetical protein
MLRIVSPRRDTLPVLRTRSLDYFKPHGAALHL